MNKKTQIVLFKACKTGDLQFVRKHFEIKNERINQTCLKYASINGNFEIVEFLIRQGVDVNSISKVIMYYIEHEKHEKILKYLKLVKNLQKIQL
jgi:hypothetical protein